jgi:hypothetical protein
MISANNIQFQRKKLLGPSRLLLRYSLSMSLVQAALFEASTSSSLSARLATLLQFYLERLASFASVVDKAFCRGQHSGSPQSRLELLWAHTSLSGS